MNIVRRLPYNPTSAHPQRHHLPAARPVSSVHPNVDAALAGQRVATAIDRLNLPLRCDHADIVAAVERVVGMNIVVRALPSIAAHRFCGIEVTAADLALVHYKDGQPAGPVTSVGHEFGHIVLGHQTLDRAQRNLTNEQMMKASRQLATKLMAQFRGDREQTDNLSDSSANPTKPTFGSQSEYEAELFSHALQVRIGAYRSRVVNLF